MKYLSVRLRAAIILLAVFLFTGTSAFLLLCDRQASADVRNNYYYEQLSAESKRFYDAIGAMEESGLLKTGKGEYDLIANGVLTEAQLHSFSVNSGVMVAFGAARDAYRLDHPEVFYIDFDYLSVSVGTKNGGFVASLGTGRADNYYIEGGFASESEVNAAIGAFDRTVGSIAEIAASKQTTEEKIRSVNAQLLDQITYTFCATADGNGTTYEEGAVYIRSPYGALVNGKAVCEGYARAFKVVMDRIGIDCVLVQGVAQGSTDGGFEPHMWNYVQLDGRWYGVDVTWNDGDGVGEEDYLLRGNMAMKAEHVPDGIVSSAQYEFRYPELYPYDYGVTEDPNGIGIEGSYIDGSSEGSKLLSFKVGYNGKSAQKLAEEDGLYLIFRVMYYEDAQPLWTVWMYIGNEMNGEDCGSYTQMYGQSSYVRYVQFAIVDYAPDLDPAGGQNFYAYKADRMTDFHMRNISEPFGNDAYGSYSAPPYVKTQTPSNTTPLNVTTTYEISVTYTEKLKVADTDKKIGISVSSQHADIMQYAKVGQVKLSEDGYSVSFSFTPSPMFQHRFEGYCFLLDNLVGENSNKEPNAIYYLTEQTNVVCSKIYNDGRLYMNVFGEPSLVSAGDLSLTGWQTEDGGYVCENQRSQLALVVSHPAEGDEMVDNATSGFSENAVLASETYELQLNVCSQIVSIPNGSTMQLAFGFPEGYGPDDAGVTFKVYHFKRGENGVIDYSKTEELACVITEYGLIVNVTDFSPFAVVALRSSEASSESKGIYMRTVGFGGSVVGDGVTVLNDGEEATYRFVPEKGYRVDRVLLNGAEQQVTGDTLTLRYADLGTNNTLTVSFVADSVAGREQEEGITPIYPMLKVDGATGNGATGGKGSDGTLAGVIAVCAVALVCGIAAILIVTVNKKKQARK